MSELKACEDLLKELELLAQSLQNPESDSQIQIFRQIETQADNMRPRMEKFRKRIAEKDPDKQIFGPKTIERIKNTLSRFDALLDRLSSDFGLHFKELADQQAASEEASKKLAIHIDKERTVALIEQGREETRREEGERNKCLEDSRKAAERQRTEVEALERNKTLQTEYVQKLLREAQELDAEAEGPDMCGSLCLGGLTEHFVTVRTESPTLLAPLAELLRQIKSNPEDVSLRCLRVLGKQFQRDIGGVPGALKILRASGFQIESASKVRVMLKSLKLDQTEDDELFLVLKEPDIRLDYEEWAAWFGRIEKIESMLMEVMQWKTRRSDRISDSEIDLSRELDRLRRNFVG